MSLDPKISTEVKRLMERAADLSQQIAQEVDATQKTIALRTDYAGLRVRAAMLQSQTTQLLYIGAQIEALRSTEYLTET
jgi:hypothetical protein